MKSGLLFGGRYRLREQLGHGGMSEVWRAEDDVLGREVAVKVLTAPPATDPGVLRLLRAEARAAARLRHAMIVEVYDYGESLHHGDAMPYVVMELVDGRTLAELLSGGPVPWRLSVLVGAQVAAALAAAHAQGVVHRDVKPGNVMVTSSGVKLVDFGISAAVGEMDGADGHLLGTPAYLAPERLAGGPVRPATDVYALGLLLYRSLAGRMPWQASTTTQMLKAHRYSDPAPLPAVAGLPHEVAVIVRRCLAKEPGSRPTAHQVAEVLGGVAGLPPSTLLQSAAAPQVRDGGRGTWRRRAGASLAPGRRKAAVAGAMAAVIAAGLAAWAIDDPENAAPTVTAVGEAGCEIRYARRSAASGGTSTFITVLNTGRTQMRPWRLTLVLPRDQRLVRGWSATWRQQGSTLEAAGALLPAGSSATTGFETADAHSPVPPMSFTLNDIPCRTATPRQISTPLRPTSAGKPARTVINGPELPEPGKKRPKIAAAPEPTTKTRTPTRTPARTKVATKSGAKAKDHKKPSVKTKTKMKTRKNKAKNKKNKNKG